MLDIHGPDETVHTWKEFFVHIAIITIGVLIAIGLEQTVEYIHHRREVNEMAARLRQESIQNQAVVAFDAAPGDAILRAIGKNLGSLEALRNQRATAQWTEAALPHESFSAPADAAWMMMRDCALLSIVPKRLAEDYWKIDQLFA